MVSARRAFTLVELMFAVAIFTVVVGSLSGVMIATMRMIRRSYAESQLAVGQRLERERLLFHVRLSTELGEGGGLLSGIEPADLRTRHSVDDALRASRSLYTVTLADSGGGMERSERIVVPVFGKEQVRNATRVFHDQP